MRGTKAFLAVFALLIIFPIPNSLGIHDGLLYPSWIEAYSQTSEKPLRVELQRTINASWSTAKMAVTNDGKRIYFPSTEADVSRLYELTVGEGTPKPIAGTDGGFYPFLSPDNKWLGFFAARKLKKIPLEGGPAEILCDAPNPFGAAWSPDGKIVFSEAANSGLWQVSERGGEKQRLTVPSVETRESNHRSPVFLPGGKSLLFDIWYEAGRHQIALLDLATDKYKILIEGASYAQYAGSGHIVYTRPDGLYAVGFNLEKQAVTGKEVKLISDIWIAPLGNRGLFEISQSGGLFYRPQGGEPYELVLVGLDGSTTPLPTPKQYYSVPRFSPDGRRIAVNVYEQGSVHTWIVDRASGKVTKLAAVANSIWPIWNPNGKQVYIYSDESGPGQWKGYLQATNGKTKPKLFFDARAEGFGGFGPRDWTPDGRYLVGPGQLKVNPDPNRGSYLLYFSPAGTPKLKAILQPEPRIYIHSTMVSPDGRWVAYVKDKGGDLSTVRIYATRFPEGGTEFPIAEGLKPLWSVDGKQIYFQASGNLQVIDVQTEPTFEAKNPRPLFNLNKNRLSAGDNYSLPAWDISPDGKYFVMVRWQPVTNPITHLNCIGNFFDQLRTKVPVGK